MDWWCLGAVLYEMLYGLVRLAVPPAERVLALRRDTNRRWPCVSSQPPFYSRNTAEMYDNILNKPVQLKPNISNAARHLLEGLLQKDRTKRLGCADDFVSSARLGPHNIYIFFFLWLSFADRWSIFVDTDGN